MGIGETIENRGWKIQTHAMKKQNTIFDQTYRGYLEQLRYVDWGAVAPKLGAILKGHGITIPVFDQSYTVSENGIYDSSGNQAAMDVCVILSRYVLMCPPAPPPHDDWVSYRDLKNSGPLTVFFAHEVEQRLAHLFMGRRAVLIKAGKALGGTRPQTDATYDAKIRLPALPKVPLLLLFNDADDDFGPQCTLLFERRAEQYLDCECLAMVGRLLCNAFRTAGFDQRDVHY
jgi:hypothetical protein